LQFQHESSLFYFQANLCSQAEHVLSYSYDNRKQTFRNSNLMQLKTLTATRYITPLREGGSLPAIVEAEDNAMYVMKFRGAGQGSKALVAELVGGEIARALGLPVPELVFMELDASLSRNEPDPEIQDLLKASTGLNLALKYLDGALAYDPTASPKPDATLASAIVWMDSYLTNVDRTSRNTNLLMWQRQLWLIDHAASLYFHFNWNGYLERTSNRFSAIKNHVLLKFASDLAQTDARLKPLLSGNILEEITAIIPDEWFEKEPIFSNPQENREAYLTYLTRRLEASSAFVEEAVNARSGRV